MQDLQQPRYKDKAVFLKASQLKLENYESSSATSRLDPEESSEVLLLIVKREAYACAFP